MKLKNIIYIVIVCLLGLIGWSFYKSKKREFLLSAIIDNDLEKVKLAINSGADVNEMRSACGRKSRLYWAINNGSPEMVALLLSMGAKVSAEQNYPLDHAIDIALGRSQSGLGESWAIIRKNQKKIISLLMDAKAETTYPEIIPAILIGDLDLVKKLTNATKQAISNGKFSEHYLKRYGFFRSAIEYSGDQEISDYMQKNFSKAVL